MPEVSLTSGFEKPPSPVPAAEKGVTRLCAKYKNNVRPQLPFLG